MTEQAKNRTSPGRSGWGKRLAVMLVTTLVLAGLAELSIRLFVPANKFIDRKTDCYWITRIRLRSEEGGKRITNVALHGRLGWTMKSSNVGKGGESTNRFGMRGTREVEVARREGVRRMVVLGDSFTFGLGVDDDATYCARLEQMVPDLEVLNMGVNGYGTDQQFLQWSMHGRKFLPDLVVIGIYVPDFHRNGLSVRELPKPRFHVRDGGLELSDLPLPGPREVLDERLDACGSPLRLMDLAGYIRRWAQGREPDESFDEKAAIMRGILERLRDSTRETGARLAVLVLPDQAYRDYMDHRRIEEVVERAGRELEIPVLNLTDPMLAWQAAHPQTPAYGDHGHWSAEGHQAGSEEILAFLRAEGLL